MTIDPGEKSPPNESARLAATLRRVGFGKLALAFPTLILAFTGYETPKPVNVGLLLIGIGLLMLGWTCLTLGKSFALASGESAPSALGAALDKANKLFGTYLVLIVLAVLGVGYDTVTFLGKILGR